MINKENLIEKTTRAYIKHFGLKIKNGFLYKKDIAIYTDDLNDKEKLLSFLLGLSCAIDSKNLWNGTETNEDYILLEQNKFNSIIKTLYALKLQVRQLESKLEELKNE